MDGLRRKDTTKGPPLRILSLDGGGVRGYSIFLILQELMHRTFVEIEGRAPRRNEIPKPCDHFDLIVGTGTGGLIALMLGRLRLDLETCKELYVRMTRMVFETDKTIAGIPYRSTLFKATKLEDAIREAVREHTISEGEGNDTGGDDAVSPMTVAARSSAANTGSPRRHSSNASVLSFSARSPTAQMAKPLWSSRGGNPNARLYDERDTRTKTAVTAVYKGTPKGGDPAMLRSYDSRREPAPEFDCTIWQAGRATCAIGLAFKPIQIGQSVFHDDGAGSFNPSPDALKEAVVNEWPGRDVGVFVSVGTGKRPKTNDGNASIWYEGFLGEFAEARRKLIAKIEGCEKIHELMQSDYLAKYGVNIENYYRLNVEVGVGEFGMNEWHRLADISTNTRRYMARDAEQKMIQSASSKLGKIHFAKMRWDRLPAGGPEIPDLIKTSMDISSPLAVELPGDIPMFPQRPPSQQSYESGQESLAVQAAHTSPRNSGERLQVAPRTNQMPAQQAPIVAPPVPPHPRTSQASAAASNGSNRPPSEHHNGEADRFVVSAPTPAEYRNATTDNGNKARLDDQAGWGRGDGLPNRAGNSHQPPRIEPPPLPPKTPLPPEIPSAVGRRPEAAPPYPLDDVGPPPVVNLARKPDYRGR